MNTVTDCISWITVITVTIIYSILMIGALLYVAMITIIQDD